MAGPTEKTPDLQVLSDKAIQDGWYHWIDGDASVPCSTKTGAIPTKDELDALRARVKALEKVLDWLHNNPTAHPENRKRVVKDAMEARHDQPDQGGGQ